MWVHGGGWQNGDKKNQVADKIRLFNDLGWVLVSVNYWLTDLSSAEPGASDAQQRRRRRSRRTTTSPVRGDRDQIACSGTLRAQIVASAPTSGTSVPTA
jgi:hypothetical protein